VTPVFFSQRARADLRGIGDYIARDNPLRAVTFVNELIDCAEAAGQSPRAYPKRDDLQTGLRMAIHRAYLIFFRVRGTRVEIVHVLHSARDLRKILKR
jgi:toxin ParE1/3/4